MDDTRNTNFKLKLSSFITGSFSEHSPTSPSCEEPDLFCQPASSLMRSSLASPLMSSGPVDNFSSAQAVDMLTGSIEAQQTAIGSLRRNWLGPLKTALDATGTLSDVTRCYRLSRILDVGVETITVEEEIRKYLTSSGSQMLGGDISRCLSTVIKESNLLTEESEGKAEVNVDRKAMELKIYSCHESVERILRSLFVVISALNSIPPSTEEATFRFERHRPTLMTTSAIDTLLMALPQKYNLEIIRRTQTEQRN